MASEAQIQMDFEAAKRQAEALEEIAKEVKKISDKKLQDSISIVDKNWNGANSSAFITKCNKLKGKMVNSAEDIEEIAGAIRKIAKVIYDAEMANIEIIKDKSYN